MGIWFSFNGVALILGGLLAYGLGHVHVDGISSWKWMFIVTGALSVLWAIALWFLLPNHQGTAWFLNETEKRVAVESVRENHTGVYNNHFRKEQLVEAMLDVKTWVLFLMALVWNIPNSIATVSTNYAISRDWSNVSELTMTAVRLPDHCQLQFRRA